MKKDYNTIKLSSDLMNFIEENKNNSQSGYNWTDEKIAFVMQARNCNRSITFDKIAKMLEKKYGGSISSSTVSSKYQNVTE